MGTRSKSTGVLVSHEGRLLSTEATDGCGGKMASHRCPDLETPQDTVRRAGSM